MVIDEQLASLIAQRLGRAGARLMELRAVPVVIFAQRSTRTGQETLLLVPADAPPDNRAETFAMLTKLGVVNQVEEY